MKILNFLAFSGSVHLPSSCAYVLDKETAELYTFALIGLVDFPTN